MCPFAVCRVAPSFIRFGSFELAYALEEGDLTEKLVELSIARHYPEIPAGTPEERALALYGACVRRHAALVAQWQGIGFTHGVLNTDNMSIGGLTIDYGPYGFIPTYEKYFVPNSSDSTGRYCYGRQPIIFKWNLFRLAAVLSNVASRERLDEIWKTFDAQYSAAYQEVMRRKLGLSAWIGGPEYPGCRDPSDEPDAAAAPLRDDEALLEAFFALLHAHKVDFTNAFRALSAIARDGGDDEPVLRLLPGAAAGGARDEWSKWLAAYRARLARSALREDERVALQRATNPKFVPRNYQLHAAIVAAEGGDLRELNALYHVLQHPFEENPAAAGRTHAPVVAEHLEAPAAALGVAPRPLRLSLEDVPWTGLGSADCAAYAEPEPAWAQRRGVTVLSCSS
jgi:uncharacterized protein YdiU (UPF0061 family)